MNKFSKIKKLNFLKTDSMYLCYGKYDIQAYIAGQYSIPITAYKIYYALVITLP